MMKTAAWFCNRIAILCRRGLRLLIALIIVITPPLCAASEPGNVMRGDEVHKDETVRLSIEGISASMGEDEPRVLNILPWRAPTLPRRPRAELESTAAELVQPLDPLVLERHREFRQNLGVGGSGVAIPGSRSGDRR